MPSRYFVNYPRRPIGQEFRQEAAPTTKLRRMFDGSSHSGCKFLKYNVEITGKQQFRFSSLLTCYNARLYWRGTLEIGRVSMMIEVDGNACVVALPQEKMRMLVDLAASLSDSGKLPVKKLGSEYKLETIEAL